MRLIKVIDIDEKERYISLNYYEVTDIFFKNSFCNPGYGSVSIRVMGKNNEKFEFAIPNVETIKQAADLIFGKKKAIK